MTGTKELRELAEKVGHFDSGEPDVCRELTEALECIHNGIYVWEAIHWRHANKKPVDHPVPFDFDSAQELPLDADGWVVPAIPTLESGKWYDHDMRDSPNSPACFVDQQTLVELFTRSGGLEEKAYKLAEVVDWTSVRKYRKYEAMDEVITGFGIF